MFLGGKFTFNNKSSTDMYDCFIGHINNYDGREVGLIKSVQRFKGNGIDIFHSVEKNHSTTPITIAFEKLLTDKEKRKVIEWLFPDDNFHELLIEDTKLSYFVLFTKAKCIEYMDGTIFECEIEFKNAFAYTQQYIYSHLVRGDKTIEIDNFCNINKFYKPIIHLQFYNDGQIEILNRNTLNKSVIKGVKDEIIDISCAREIAISDKKDFKYSDIEGFVKLKQGINILEIKGQCRIEFMCRYPMLME